MLRLVLAIPLLVVLVIFAVSNRQPVVLSFLGYATNVALSVAVLAAAAIFFLLGALLVWFGELRQRRRARRAELRVRELETALAAARAAAVVPAAAPAQAALPAA